MNNCLQWTTCDESNIESQNFDLTINNKSHCACVAQHTTCTFTLNLHDIVRTIASATQTAINNLGSHESEIIKHSKRKQSSSSILPGVRTNFV